MNISKPSAVFLFENTVCTTSFQGRVREWKSMPFYIVSGHRRVVELLVLYGVASFPLTFLPHEHDNVKCFISLRAIGLYFSGY